MESFCIDLKKHAKTIINYKKKKKEMIPLTNKETKTYIVSRKYVIYVKKDLALIMTIKSIINSEIIVITQENNIIMIFKI